MKKRFTEIISIQKIVDEETNIQYDAFVCDDFIDLINMIGEENKKLKNENRLLKLNYGKCRDCKYANLYIPSFTYPFFDPKCELGIKKIHAESNACEDFELVGRFGR